MVFNANNVNLLKCVDTNFRGLRTECVFVDTQIRRFLLLSIHKYLETHFR